MEKISLSPETMKLISQKKKDITVDGIEWRLIDTPEPEEDEHGRCFDCVYIRLSDKRHFIVTVFLVRYGHKDYGYEEYAQDMYAVAVKKKEVTTIQWVLDKEE